ncbi:MAG: BrnA antitoxin family protein [Magnetococcales bacterium]|nr:BrnA antitoxin family protein [Magnetococcales bacterium]
MNEKTTSPRSESDWRRIAALSDEKIDLSDSPAISSERMAKALRRKGLQPLPQQSGIHIDDDVLEWFKGQGCGYQEQINTILRAYKETHSV